MGKLLNMEASRPTNRGGQGRGTEPALEIKPKSMRYGVKSLKNSMATLGHHSTICSHAVHVHSHGDENSAFTPIIRYVEHLWGNFHLRKKNLWNLASH